MDLYQMIEGLLDVDEMGWGMYLFSKDILKDKMTYQEKREMIKQAVYCGKEKANELINNLASSHLEEIVQKLHLQVKYLQYEGREDRVTFALFTTPNLIQVMEEPIKQAIKCQEILGIISEEEIKSLILGHEIFHYLESQDKRIYTMRKKIELWHLGKYTHQSTIRALSEIAATSFTKRLNRFPYSPLLLDVILYYHYSIEETEKIYKEILSYKSF